MNPNISFGTLNTVVSGEMLSMQTVIPQAFLDFIVAVTSLTLTSLFLLFIDWRLSLVTIAVIPAVAPFYLWQKNVLARGLRKRSDSLAMLNCEVIEYVEGMEVLKAFKQTGKQFKKFKDVNISVTMKAELLMTLTQVMIDLGLCLILLFGAFEL